MKRVRILKRFHSAYEGNRVPREVVHVRDDRAGHLVEIGVAELLEPEVTSDPLAGAPSPSSQPDPAPAQSPSVKSGDTRQSQSTTRGESARGQGGSTRATTHGGSTTTQKSSKTSAASSGRRTRKRRAASSSTE